jgi:uncharacterized protein (TIGR02246 family)
MPRISWSIVVLASMVIVASPSAQTQSDSTEQGAPSARKEQEKPAQRPKADHAADGTAIRANVTAFVKAYNAKDAKAVAALFTPDGQVVDQDGNASEGRDAIERVFADLFSESPQKRIEVTVDSIRFVGPDLAVEEGSTKETSGPGEPPEYDGYTVLHVKRDGRWLMALARDEEGKTQSSHEQLRPLAWLVGDWIDDGGNVVVNSSCRWSEDGNFLLQEFALQISGRNAMRVSQRIGWDPIAKRVRSWVFDSEGGYGESLWTRDGDIWVIKATGVRPDGTTASSTNVLVPAGKDGYVWRSRDRIVGDEVAPAMEVKVVRKPPQPKR